MTKNTLEKIIDNRIIEIEQRKNLVPIERLINNISDYENMYENKFYNFKKRIEDNVKNNKISIIELKELIIGNNLVYWKLIVTIFCLWTESS